MNPQTRNNKSEKQKRNLGHPYKSGRPIKQPGLYTCRYCNQKVDFHHVCDKEKKLWKNPQSKRSDESKLLIKQNKISK